MYIKQFPTVNKIIHDLFFFNPSELSGVCMFEFLLFVIKFLLCGLLQYFDIRLILLKFHSFLSTEHTFCITKEISFIGIL